MPRRRRGWTPVDWFKAGVFAATGMAVGWLVIIVSAPRALPQAALARLGLDGGASHLVYREATEELIAGRGRISDATYDRVLAAWPRDPMAGEPLFFASIRALLANDMPTAERLLGEARVRDPRLGAVRLALVALYLRSNRVAPAAVEIAAVTRIVPRATERLVPELAEVVRDPNARAPLVAAIGDQPLMTALLDYLAPRGTDPELVLALAERQSALPNGQFRPWQSNVIEQFVSRGDIVRARELWRRFSGATENAGALIYDPDFRGLPGGPPFNWRLVSDGVAAAERAPSGGLDVEYFGRRSGVIASQLLSLAPGTYRLRFQAEGDANGQGSRLSWRVTCGTDRALLDLPLTEVTYTPKAVEGRFAVPPSGCSAQTVALVGAAGEFPTRQSLRISRLSLDRAGSAQ